MICPVCFSENKNDAKFCNECGAPLFQEEGQEQAFGQRGDDEPLGSFEEEQAYLPSETAPIYLGEDFQDNRSSSYAPYPDLSGIDECLVDATYVPPSVSQMGDTMQIPVITDEMIARQTQYRASNVQEKGFKKWRKERAEKKAQKALEALKVEEERLENERLAALAAAEEARALEEGQSLQMRDEEERLDALAEEHAADSAEAKPEGDELLLEASADQPEQSNANFLEGVIPLVVEEAAESCEAELSDSGSLLRIPEAIPAEAPDESEDYENASLPEEEQYPEEDQLSEEEQLFNEGSEDAEDVEEEFAPDVADEALSPDDLALEDEDELPSDLQEEMWEKDSSVESTLKSDAFYRADEKKRVRKIALVVAALLLVVGVCVAGITYYLEIWGGRTLPDVVGLTQADASFVLESKGFEVVFSDEISDDVEGVVLSMSPAAGYRIESGTEVTVCVSRARVVPEVVGLSLEEAQAKLAESGYASVSVEEVGSPEEPGLVIGMDVAAGTKATADTPIVLQVATPFVVPDVSGMSASDAESALRSAGYEVEYSYVYDNSLDPESASGTSPEAGTELDEGATVILYIVHDRSADVTQLARDYLSSSNTITLNGVTYTMSSVEEVFYHPEENTTSFRVNVVLANGSIVEKQGWIKWSENNEFQGIFAG